MSDYRVMKGDSILTSILTRTNPTDTTITLSAGKYLFYSECKDRAKNEVTSDTSYVEVTRPKSHISGQLQDTRTDLGAFGRIQVYNAADSTFLKALDTDLQGYFDFRLDTTAVSGILLQARIDKVVSTGLVPGFVRTIRFPGRDTTNLLIRAYPYNEVLDNAGISRLDFLIHLDEMNPTFQRTQVHSIEIINMNPLEMNPWTGEGYRFTPEQQNFIKEKILDPSDIMCLTDGRRLHVQIDTPETPPWEKHYSIGKYIDRSGWPVEILPDSGWGVVAPFLGGGLAKTFNEYMFRINLSKSLDDTNNFLVSHEFGHPTISPHHHAETLLRTQSIMTLNSEPVGFRLSTPGPADCEAAKVIYEETYNRKESPRWEIYPDILGLEFLPRQ